MLEKMDRMPLEIGQAWMRLITTMGLEKWIAG